MRTIEWFQKTPFKTQFHSKHSDILLHMLLTKKEIKKRRKMIPFFVPRNPPHFLYGIMKLSNNCIKLEVS